MATSPNIPAVPSGLDSQTRAFLTAVKENLETMQGKRRNTDLKAVVTFEDLQRLGLSVSKKSISTDAGYDFSRIVRGDNPPNPPRDLAISNSVVSNKLTWTNPTNGAENLSHVEIWCGFGSESLSDALKIGIATYPVEEYVHSGLNTQTSHTYWIRTVDWSGNYSTWEPTSGGLLVAADSSATINELLATLTDDTQYETVHKIIADSFQVLQPSEGLEDPVAVFVVGQVGDETAVGINGNLFIDGTVLARHLDGDIINGAFLSASAQIQLGVGGLLRIEEGGKLFAGSGNFLLDTGDTTKLLMGEDGAIDVQGNIAVGKDYTAYTGTDIEFWRWMESQHVLFRSLKRVSTGYAENGSTVLLDGYWESAPQVHLSPRNLACYDSSSPSVDQTLNLEVTTIELQSGHTNKYQFQANARLVIGAGTSDFAVGFSDSETSDTGTAETAEYTTPAYCTAASISYKIKAIKPEATINTYKRRSVVLKVYVDDVEEASRTIEIGETIDYLTGTISVTGLSSSAVGHDIYLTATASDATGTFVLGNVTYDYEDGSETANLNISGGITNFNFPDPVPSGDGWERTSYIQYVFDLGTCYSSNPWVQFRLAGGSVYDTKYISDGYAVSYDQLFPTGTFGQGAYACVLQSVTTTASYRRPQSSTASLLTEVEFTSLSVTLDGASTLATGTVNYIAMESN